MVRLSEVLCCSSTLNLRRTRSVSGSVVLNNHHPCIRAMTKATIEAINEAIRDPNHPFRKADYQPKKAMKHRYERRKIKEYLHLADWEAEPV